MFNWLIAKLYELAIYHIPQHDSIPWFASIYTDTEKNASLGMLKTLIEESNSADNKTIIVILEVSSDIIFNLSQRYVDIKTVSLTDGMDILTHQQQNDFLVLALIITLSSTTELNNRIKSLLAHWQYFDSTQDVKKILHCLLNNDIRSLKTTAILGEGSQNKMARLNGIKSCGWFEYKQQMKSMQHGKTHPELKQKYAFLTKLTPNTLGGALRDLLRSEKLSLPGEPYGFPGFFLWHDLSHVLSGNKTNYPGELGVNAFAAGYSAKCKFQVLLFGLIQFNLGIPLAVVATTAKNQFKSKQVISQYLFSLLSGTQSKLDLLLWPEEQMVADLKTNLDDVRQKYCIKPLKPGPGF